MKDYTDWYFVSISQVLKHGGAGLLNHHKGSIIRALRTVYPEHGWNLWRFSSRAPHNATKSKTHFSKSQHLLFQHLKTVSV